MFVCLQAPRVKEITQCTFEKIDDCLWWLSCVLQLVRGKKRENTTNIVVAVMCASACKRKKEREHNQHNWWIECARERRPVYDYFLTRTLWVKKKSEKINPYTLLYEIVRTYKSSKIVQRNRKKSTPLLYKNCRRQLPSPNWLEKS